MYQMFSPYSKSEGTHKDTQVNQTVVYTAGTLQLSHLLRHAMKDIHMES